MQGFLML